MNKLSDSDVKKLLEVFDIHDVDKIINVLGGQVL